MPFSQPEDMSEVNKKLAHISSLATSSISAPEAAAGGSIKLRDDELKEAASSENIPILAGESETSRLGRENSRTPSDGTELSSSSAQSKVAGGKKPESVEVATNGNDVKMTGHGKPKLRDQTEAWDDDDGTGKKVVAKKNSAVAKRDIRDASKREEEKLDVILGGIKSGVGSYSRTKRADNQWKSGRLNSSKPSTATSRFSDKMTSYSATSLLPTTSISTDTKEQAKSEKDSKVAIEEISKNKENHETLSSSSLDPVLGSSSTGALVTGKKSISVKSEVGSSYSVSPATQRDETFQSSSSIKDRKRRQGFKSDSFDDVREVRESSGSRCKVNGKSISLRSSPTQEIFLHIEESKHSSDKVRAHEVKSDASIKNTVLFDEKLSVTVGQQEPLDSSQVTETKATETKATETKATETKVTEAKAAESQMTEPTKEMSDRERKRLARMKRRGSVDKTIQKKMNKSKMVMSEERRSSTSDDSAPPVVTPKSLSSPHDEAFAKEPVILEEEPSGEPRVTSPNQLATPKASSNSSPKASKHRPTTPEPMSPTISSTKLLHSPERRTRRKSEGMRPIERRSKRIDPQEGTLQEENHNEDEEENAVAAAAPVVECPPKEVEDPAKEVKGSSDDKATVSKLDEEILKSGGRNIKNPALVKEERTDGVVKSSSSVDVISRPQSQEGFRLSANSSPVKDISASSTLSSASASNLSCTNEKMDRGEKASSRPSSRSSSRPSSRTDHRQASSEKDSSVKSKPSSPDSTVSRAGTSSKYTSCTANAFTNNSLAFKTEETRPYTSVLRSKPKSSVSSFTRTPIEDAWRYESSTGYTPFRRLSANPVRNRGTDLGDVSGRTSHSQGSEHSVLSPQNQDEKESLRSSKVTSGNVSLDSNDKTKEKVGASSNVRPVSPASESTSKSGTVPEDSAKVEANSSKANSMDESPPTCRFGSPRRAYVKREEMEDTGTPLKKNPSSQYPPASEEDSAKEPSHSILDTTGPDIVVRTPSVSDATNLSPPPPPVSSPSPRELSAGEVIMRRKKKLANPKRASWRQTPVISPDVVDMILKGEIFDSDDERLETCMEVNEDDQSFKKFLFSESRSSSQNREKHRPILKSSKPSSPENGQQASTNKTSTPLLSEKKVSINEDSSWINYQENRRRKFLSMVDRSYTLDNDYSEHGHA